MDLDTNLQYLLLAAFLLISLWLYLRYRNLRITINEKITNPVVLRISIPHDNDKSPLAAEQMYASIYGILRSQKISLHHFSLEIVAGSYGIFFLAVINKRYQQFLENQIYAQYPTAQIKEIKDYAAGLMSNRKQVASSELGLTKEFFLPIKTFKSFDVDPLASICSSVSKLSEEQEVFIQFVVRPINNSWQSRGRKFVDARKSKEDNEGKKVALEAGEGSELKEVELKSSKLGFQFLVRIIAQANNRVVAQQLLEDVEASFRQFQTGQFNAIGIKPVSKGFKQILLGYRQQENLSVPTKYLTRLLDERSTDIINIEELASLFHLPNNTVEVSRIAWSRSKKLPYPINLPGEQDNARILGLTDYRNQHIPYGLRSEDRKRHTYILGKTGTGKSTLLKNLIMGDIYDGKGVGVIDPHGELIDQILELIPEHRINDVVLLDPSDVEYPLGLNLVSLKEGEERDMVADGIVSIFKKFFGDSWGPRLQYILTNTIVSLLQVQNVSLLAVTRILEDHNYRKFILKQVKDPIIAKFWEREFEEMVNKNPRMLAEALSPIQNKVGRFTSSGIIRNIVGQVKSTVDLQEVMDEGKIFLVNLSQGKIGEENSALLGGMLVTRIYTNAMQRARIPESMRRDFYLYVDEFQNFASESFVKILSEARKYGLNLTVAHQYIDQLEPEVRDAIFGNVGTLLSFVVGQRDAAFLSKEYTPYLSVDDLVNLERFHFVNKITVEGSQTPPFTAISLPPKWVEQGNKQKIMNRSREKYTQPREVIEQKITKWAATVYDEKGNLVQSSK